MIMDKLVNAPLYMPCHSDFDMAFAFISQFEKEPLAPGRYEIDGNQIFALVQSYETVMAEGTRLEAHRKYIDIQYVMRGEELMGFSDLAEAGDLVEGIPADDIFFYSGKPDTWLNMQSGSFAVFFPQDAHMPCIKTRADCQVLKVVVKIAVSK